MLNTINIALNKFIISNYVTEKLLLVSIFSVLVFFVLNDYLSYKIAFATQSIIGISILISKYKIKLNNFFLYFNIPVILIFLFGIEKQTFYLLLIAFINLFIFYEEKQKQKINKYYIDPKYFMLFLVITSINLYSKNGGSNFLLDLIRFLQSWNYFDFKYGILDLNAGMTGMILSIISLIFFKQYKIIKFNTYFIFSTFFIFTVTGSKASLLFCLTVILCSFKAINKKFLLSLFIILNIFVILAGTWVVKNLPNPFVNEELYGKKFYTKYTGKNSHLTHIYIQSIPYVEVICPKFENSPFRILTECESVKNPNSVYSKNFVIKFIQKFKIFGYSSYYKFASYGFSIEYIFKNSSKILFPKYFKTQVENKTISQYKYSNHYAAHNAMIGTFLHFGLFFGLLFLINIIYFAYKSKDKFIFPILIASTFFTIDIFLLLPLMLLNNVIVNNQFYNE